MLPRRLKALNGRHWFLAVVALPTLLATIYYGLIDADEYLSESSFVIRSPAQRQGQVSTLANLIQTTGISGGEEQSREVVDYLRSRAALADLQKRIDVRRRFMSSEADVLSRFPAPWNTDAFENLYLYYGRMVDPHIDHESGTAELSVKAFTPQDAQAINAALLDLGEGLVNRLNERAQRKAIDEAERRVVAAQARVRAARAALGAYRNREALIDPAKQATGVLDVSNRLVAEQAALQAQLDLTRRLAPRNPAIPEMESRVAAIGRAIGSQNARAVGAGGAIASKLGGYENLALEQEFAAQNLTAAQASLEQARTEAVRQQYYLARVVEPNLPDLALFPQRLKSILVIAACALCLYFIGWMLVTGILEHAPGE